MKLATCACCRANMPLERLEIFPTCIKCTTQRSPIAVVEGISKQGSIVIVNSGTEGARRAFNQGNAVIRRSVPKNRRIS